MTRLRGGDFIGEEDEEGRQEVLAQTRRVERLAASIRMTRAGA